MGFIKPKIPVPTPAANPAMMAQEFGPNAEELGLAGAAGSLISTSSQGLRRRASTQRTSLIGG